MSNATVPLGMNSMPASGYNHHSTLDNCAYVTWKGDGINSNPVGIAATHVRPLTNNDPGNVFPAPFGLPRPLKHFRKGRVIPTPPLVPPAGSTPLETAEINQINYNLNRATASSLGTSLGGGFGGSGLLNELLDKPGAYIVKENPATEVNETQQLQQDCRLCQGVGVVTTYFPNKNYLTNNPEPVTTQPRFCCNEERKAKRRAIYASTNLKKNYYTTHYQYLQNRCQTYDQKDFNFLPVAEGQAAPYKPGSPAALAVDNVYIANCYPNDTPLGCKLTVYKPSNYQFAVQGGVSSSTRNLKLNVDTITTNAASIAGSINNTGPAMITAQELYEGNDPAIVNMLKNKHSPCNVFPPQPFQNKRNCQYAQLPGYTSPVSQPSPYRNYPSTVFSSNHFNSTMGTYLNTTGTR